jgi:hypothetical protein
MKDRLFLLAILLIGGAALYFGLSQPNVSRVPKRVRDPAADLKPAIPPLEPPVIAIPAIPLIELPPPKDVIPPFAPALKK